MPMQGQLHVVGSRPACCRASSCTCSKSCHSHPSISCSARNALRHIIRTQTKACLALPFPSPPAELPVKTRMFIESPIALSGARNGPLSAPSSSFPFSTEDFATCPLCPQLPRSAFPSPGRRPQQCRRESARSKSCSLTQFSSIWTVFSRAITASDSSPSIEILQTTNTPWNQTIQAIQTTSTIVLT